MEEKVIKAPATKEEYEKLLDSLNEVNDDELDGVVGGNDDLKGKLEEGTYAICGFCGAKVMTKMTQDMAKHITQDCPNNPFKK